jgi:hypothetical protein
VSTTPGGVPLPPSVRWSVRCWLGAVTAGVLETVLHALSEQDFDAAAQLPVRAAVYLLATVVIVALRRGRNWARIALTVLLGGLGLLSLLAEPISWLAAGGSPGGFLGAADGVTLAVFSLRVLHVAAVLGALPLMYTPVANRFFRQLRRDHPT